MANRTRDALAGRTSAMTIAQVRKDVAAALRTVDAILTREGQRVEHLPAPTRNAYRYLAEINWNAVQQQPAGAHREPARGRIRFSGLSSFFDRLLHQLGSPEPTTDPQASFETIQRTARRLTEDLAKDAIDRSQLTAESRRILAWLTYFTQQATFDRLRDAIRSARAALMAEFELCQTLELPVVMHFRPIKSLYRVRRFQDASLVELPTPMICFGADDYMCLAAAICGDNSARRPVLERTATQEYRAIQTELDGPVDGDQSSGAFHDLEAAFLRVSQAYFGGAMAKPRLIWSRRITGRKFGHFDPVRDELMVSATLDSSNVPTYMIDFIVYHELLHKKHGAAWQNGRQSVHTAAFRDDERRFAEYAAAESALQAIVERLASGVSRPSPAVS